MTDFGADLDYEPRDKLPVARTSVTGVLAAIGLAGLICIALMVVATLFVTYFL
jgi:hypothetical protein